MRARRAPSSTSTSRPRLPDRNGAEEQASAAEARARLVGAFAMANRAGGSDPRRRCRCGHRRARSAVVAIGRRRPWLTAIEPGTRDRVDIAERPSPAARGGWAAGDGDVQLEHLYLLLRFGQLHGRLQAHPPRRRRGVRQRDDPGASRGRRYRAARLRGGRRRRPSSSHRARVHDGRPGGGGVRSAALQPTALCDATFDYSRRSEPPRLSALYGRCHELGQTAATSMLHFCPWKAAWSPVNVFWCAPPSCCSVSS